MLVVLTETFRQMGAQETPLTSLNVVVRSLPSSEWWVGIAEQIPVGLDPNYNCLQNYL